MMTLLDFYSSGIILNWGKNTENSDKLIRHIPGYCTFCNFPIVEKKNHYQDSCYHIHSIRCPCPNKYPLTNVQNAKT